MQLKRLFAKLPNSVPEINEDKINEKTKNRKRICM